MPHTRTGFVVVAACLGGAGAFGQPQTFEFTLNPAASGLSGSLSAGVDTSGTLIGNWNAATNPTGTRTKPGLFGSFGPTENLPVPTTLGGDAAGPIDTEGAGSLRLRLGPLTQTCQLTGLAVDFVTGAPILVPANGTIDFDSFRTRAPDSTYPGVPVSLPIGDIEVTDLQATQSAPATGTLMGGIPGVFVFEVSAAVEVTGTMSLMGNTFDLPATPLLLVIQGNVTVSGSRASLTSSQAAGLVVMQQPGEPIPEFPLDVPTVLPAGATSHLLMNLILNQIDFSLTSTLTLAGDGLLVPDCYPDCTGDGNLTVADFSCFQTKFVAADPYADCNQSGTLTVADFSCFQSAFVAGCP